MVCVPIHRGCHNVDHLSVIFIVIAAILVYDITNRSSFGSLESWIKDFKEHCPHATIALVGNKSDCTSSRAVLLVNK